MGLIARHDAHAAQRRHHGGLFHRGDLVVVPRDDLLVVRIRALDEPREHERPAGAEPDVVVALGDLDIGVGREQAADLLQRLGGHNQVRGHAALRGHVHLREAVPVRGHHPHSVWPELPQHAVQDRPALLSGGGERHVADQLVHYAGRSPPGAVELHGGEGRELFAGQAQQLELGAATLDPHARLAGRSEAHWPRRQLPGDVHQFLRGQRDAALGVHVGRDHRAHRDVEIGARQPQALLRGFDKGVGQDGQRRLGRDGRCHGAETFLKLLACDRELHPRFPPRSRGAKEPTGVPTIELLSSSSRGRGNVRDRPNP